MVKAHYMLAVTLRELSKRPEAVDQCMQAIGKDPKYGKAHYLLGLMHWENGDFADARRHFSAAVQYAADQKSRERAENWLKNLDQ